MKSIKILIAAAIVVFTVAAVGAGIVVAKSSAVWDRIYPGSMMGQTGTHGGMMNGATHSQMMNGESHAQMMGGTSGEDDGWMDQMHAWMSESGGMHTIVWNGLAEALEITPEELTTELSSGKTITQIAESRGIQKEQLAQNLEALVKAGLDKAVTEKVITQEQANLMLAHMDGNYLWMLDHMSSFNSTGSGGCHQNNPPQSKNTNG